MEFLGSPVLTNFLLVIVVFLLGVLVVEATYGPSAHPMSCDQSGVVSVPSHWWRRYGRWLLRGQGHADFPALTSRRYPNIISH